MNKLELICLRVLSLLGVKPARRELLRQISLRLEAKYYSATLTPTQQGKPIGWHRRRFNGLIRRAR